jgi:hypothetical protein
VRRSYSIVDPTYADTRLCALFFRLFICCFRFSGSVHYLANLMSLNTLQLSDNQFTGALALAIVCIRFANLTLGSLVLPSSPSLSGFEADRNEFSSGLDRIDLSYHHDLVIVNLSHNNFSGKLPEILSPTTQRPLVFDIQKNFLSCPYPVVGTNVVLVVDACLHNWVMI